MSYSFLHSIFKYIEYLILNLKCEIIDSVLLLNTIYVRADNLFILSHI